MEIRKRKSDYEAYVSALTDPPEKQRKMTEFYNSLRMFYKRRWNASLKLPHVQGVEVNLHRLYEIVMALGGWQKVALSDKWSDIAEAFGCRDDILCGDHAIKLIYMRYLSKFEQVETIGDVDDYVDNEMSRSRGRNATSFFATNDCPISTNRSDNLVRDERGQIVNEPDYARLTKSLISGLPNEIDFAMNVCMLLSHAGPKQLRICHAPTLLTLLVAHTGIFEDNEVSTDRLAFDWKTTTSQNFNRLWQNSGIPSDLLSKFLGDFDSKLENDDDESFFTGTTDTYNVKDARCWRINQVSTIIRNLSFEPVNRVTIVKTWPVMKFLIMCASCKWSPLYVAALDALSNLATDIDLTDKTLVHVSQHAILRIIHDGVFSSDKFKLVRSLEMLTGLCGFEGNEGVICDWLSGDIISQILEVVGVKDIMMCVYTLECLYQISEMGDTACDLISDSPRAIQQLVSMATLEAVSFGPAGLSGMKVVEYQPQYSQPGNGFQTGISNQSHPQQHAPQRHIPSNSNQNAGQTVQQPMTVRQVIQNNLALQQVQRENMQREQSSHSTTVTSSPTTPAPQSASKADRQTGNIAIRPIAPSTNSGDNQLEQLTEKWIKRNCVFEPSMSTARGELYAAYVDDLRNIHHSMSGSLAMFSGVMKNLYPEINFRIAHNGIKIVAQGIRLVRPHRLAPTASQSAAEPHPIMRKILTSAEQNEKTSNQVDSQQQNQTISVDEKPLLDEEKTSVDSPKKEATEKATNIVSNGSAKPKKESMASRAAHIVAVAAACNGNLEKMNEITGDSKSEINPAPQQEGNEKKPAETSEESKSDEHNEPAKNNNNTEVPAAPKITDYMCDWDCCSLYFNSPSHVLKHLSDEHVAEELRVLCRWNGCCDPTPRNRWSLITHIQDSHCNEAQLKQAAQKRREGGGVPTRGIPRLEIVPRDLNNHPGYAKNAAFDAIRRHAFNFLSRELTDEAEGPVTKSIRLSSCLILRNLARYSADGRQKLRRHESHLCWLALSRLESSHALSQLLSELHQLPSSEDEQQKLASSGSVNSLSPDAPNSP